MDVLYTRFAENKLSMSMEKTKYIMFHARQRIVSPIDLRINGHTLTYCTSAKLLGMSLESRLLWKDHSDILTRKIYS